MDYQFLAGLLIADGSFTGDSKYPCISIRMRDTSYPLLSYVVSLYGGKLYGPYDNPNSHSNGQVIQVMWRGDELRRLLPALEETGFQNVCSHFGAKYEAWKSKYSLSVLPMH